MDITDITQEQFRQFVIDSDKFLVKKYRKRFNRYMYKYSVYYKTKSGYASKAYNGWDIINNIAAMLGTDIHHLTHIDYGVRENHINI